MIDPREGVAKEFAARVFTRLFVRPKGWEDQQAAEHIGACVSAVIPFLPRSRPDGLALTEGAAHRLKAEAKTNAWPTVREVLEAVQAERKAETKRKTGPTGWPHANTDFVVESATRWVKRFGEWPSWLEHDDEVANAMLASGTVTDLELAQAGYLRAVDRRVDADKRAAEANNYARARESDMA